MTVKSTSKQWVFLSYPLEKDTFAFGNGDGIRIQALKQRDSFPNLRVLGFDSISITSFAHRQTGKMAHRCILEGNRPLLILEDMDLNNVSGDTLFKQITIALLRVSQTDASLCTVLALISNV